MALMDPELEKKALDPTKTTTQTQQTMQATSTPQQTGAQTRGLGETTPYQDNVGQAAADLMSQDSPLMQKAKAEGMQFANRRGLLNSSIAGQAAQSAVLDRVVPMASQQAQQGHAKNLQSNEQAFQGEQAQLDRDLRIDIVEREEQLQRDKMAQEVSEAALDRDVKIALEEMKIALDEKKIGADDRRGVDSMLSNVFRDYEEAQRSILNNPDLPAEERNALLDNARNMLNAKVNYISSLYGTTFNWPSNPFSGVGGGTGTGTGTGTSGGEGGGEGGEGGEGGGDGADTGDGGTSDSGGSYSGTTSDGDWWYARETEK